MALISDLIASENILVREVIKKIDKNASGILFLHDECRKMTGVVTDGDIRRWILKNGSLEETVQQVMNTGPVYLYENQREEAYHLMESHQINALPLLDDEDRIIKVIFWQDFHSQTFIKYGKIEIPVVIMAGGKGSRLYPYTKILPKPLIPIGEIPIVERIMNRFSSFGCKKFYLTVNYKKNMIKSYFNDEKLNYQVDFVEEDSPLGTGGSLSLLKNHLQGTFFVSNCDILVEEDYSAIYHYHRENKNGITMITSMKNFMIPYGVVHIDDNSNVVNISEKPENMFLVNTGMYVVESFILEKIPENTYYDLPQLIEQCIKDGIKVGTYPVSESAWLDMGQFSEMDIMLEKLGFK